MPRICIVLAALLLASASGHAQDDGGWQPPPAKLTIGYEGEGQVDASPKACEAMVREIVQWSEEETKHGIKIVCDARKRHIEAYAALQASYKALAKHIAEDHRLNPVASIKSFEAMIRDCIEHKSNINTGGHNIYIDMIANHVATECLRLGKGVLDSEAAWFDKGGSTEDRPAP
jgi:hypothetical protein